jgi:hypothetical protein
LVLLVKLFPTCKNSWSVLWFELCSNCFGVFPFCIATDTQRWMEQIRQQSAGLHHLSRSNWRCSFIVYTLHFFFFWLHVDSFSISVCVWMTYLHTFFPGEAQQLEVGVCPWP